MNRPTLTLRPGAERRLLAGYPWVFSNEIVADPEQRTFEPGGLVNLLSADGKALAVGSYNRHALIAFRVFDRNSDAKVDVDWVVSKLNRALETRECVYPGGCYRLIHGEADGLPGVIIDRYGDALSVQINTAGADKLRETLIEALDQVIEVVTLVIRGDTAQRTHEGLEEFVETVRGDADEVLLNENGLTFGTSLVEGQKTGWFFDQRDNRALLAGLVSQFENPAVLDGYCYAGGFAIAMAAAGGNVTAVDRSGPAIDWVAKNADMNDVSIEGIKADVFNALERFASDKRQFALVNLDPPAFAKSKKSLRQGLKGYRKLTRLGAAVVEPGGFLAIHSCSHHVDLTALTEQVGRGLVDAGRAGQVLYHMTAGADHPSLPQLAESQYLKGLVLRLD